MTVRQMAISRLYKIDRFLAGLLGALRRSGAAKSGTWLALLLPFDLLRSFFSQRSGNYFAPERVGFGFDHFKIAQDFLAIAERLGRIIHDSPPNTAGNNGRIT